MLYCNNITIDPCVVNKNKVPTQEISSAVLVDRTEMFFARNFAAFILFFVSQSAKKKRYNIFIF